MKALQHNSLLKHTARATAALGLAAASTMATAAPLTELFFSQNSGFAVLDATGEFATTNVSVFAAADPNTAGDSVPDVTTFNSIFWKGTSFEVFSALFIENFTSDTTTLRFEPGLAAPDVDGEWNEGDVWVIDTLTHFNNEIGGGNFSGQLWVADTIADLGVFTDAVGGNALVTDPDSTSQFTFFETLNSNTACPTPSPFFDGNGPLNADAPPAPGCGDYYDVALGVFDPIVSAPVDGYVYEINFTLVPGSTFIGTPDGLGGETLLEVGEVLICGLGFACDPIYDPAPGLLRVYTPEYGADATTFGVSQLSIGAFWSAREVPVPAPAPLALIGVGLIGASLRRSRKRA